jgi:hypothetical protein
MTYRILGSLAATSLGAVLQIPQLSCAQDVGTKIIEPPSILFCQPNLLATHGGLEADTSNISEADTSISEADTSISEVDTSNWTVRSSRKINEFARVPAPKVVQGAQSLKRSHNKAYRGSA